MSRSCEEKLGETAVTESAREPSACQAAQAKYPESAPPESATITDGTPAKRAKSARSFSSTLSPLPPIIRIGTKAVMFIQTLLDLCALCVFMGNLSCTLPRY